MSWKPCLSLLAVGVLLASGCRRDTHPMRGDYENAASKFRELSKEIERLNAEVEKLEAENKQLRAEAKRLRAQLDAVRGGGKTSPTGKGGAR